jgi:hypothetical protein
MINPMTLHQRKQRKILSVAEKTGAKIVALRNTSHPDAKKIFSKTMLMPPITQFNMGYMKEKENDPL